MSTNTVTVQIPIAFWDDHMSRECTDALEAKRTAKKIKVTLDYEGWCDLVSDSGYYIDRLDESDHYMRALGVSAVWTLSALAKTEIPWEPNDYQLTWLGDLPKWAHPKNWAAWTGRGQ